MIGTMKEMKEGFAGEVTSSAAIPALDANAPATFETATFALG